MANETEATLVAPRCIYASPRSLTTSIATHSPLALSSLTLPYSTRRALIPGMSDESYMEEHSEQDGDGMDERRRSWVRDVAGAATEGRRASDRGSGKRLILFTLVCHLFLGIQGYPKPL
jgi:hypothetical protein